MGVADACGRCHWGVGWSSLWGHETCEECAEIGVTGACGRCHGGLGRILGRTLGNCIGRNPGNVQESDELSDS
eukprot:6333746-Pyramimonas_sp.AAC.1